MNKTEHYNLNQWELHDRVMMQDFNADNATLDAALTEHADRVAALEQQVPLLGNCRVAIYSYVGNGNFNQERTVIPYTEKPLFAIVFGGNGTSCFAAADVTSGELLYHTSTHSIGLSWSNTCLQLRASNTALMQMNEKDIAYFAVMFLSPKS